MITQCKKWLNQALTLWLEQGADFERGNFAEVLSFEKALGLWDTPQRSMVHCRQIYVLNQATKLGLLDADVTKNKIKQTSQRFIKYNLNKQGMAYHSVDSSGVVVDERPDLYGQAFALFGLAQSYEVFKDPIYKEKALALVHELNKTRRTELGGYTELNINNENIYASNPHMHLFEAVIEWMKIETDTTWTKLAKELLELCLNYFLDSENELIGEHFNESWQHKRKDNRFMFEPGHQYEWAWLMGEYQKLTGHDLTDLRFRIFQNMEERGLSKESGAVFDEVLSDYRPQKTSSRFWPQCERIKLALQLAHEVEPKERSKYFKAADESMKLLFQFLDTPIKGLWYDTLLANGEMKVQPAKASSFYHIMGGFSEYLKLRE